MADIQGMTALPFPNQTVRRAERSPAFLLLVVLAICLTVWPLAGLAILAFGGGTDDLVHLASTVLPGSILVTAQVMFLVALLTGTIGVISAWLVISFDFPMRKTLAWMLILPVAMPAYLASYSFVEFFHFTGPVQTAIRSLFGFKTNTDYWFPDIRSVWGAGFVLSVVLYPYVYLSTRVVFLLQGRNAADVARALGAGPARVFGKILLPMARPAIAAGIALALMETLNDIGAVEYLGVRTLTFSVYNTWLARGSLAGAAQIALFMMIVVFALLALESHARRQLKFSGSRASHFLHPPVRRKLRGGQALIAALTCFMPVLIGFGIPFWVLVGFAAKRLDQLMEPAFVRALGNSVFVGGLAAAITVLASLFLMHAGRSLQSRKSAILLRLASMGYAVPGTVLAIGLIFTLGSADRWLNSGLSLLGLPAPGLFFSGSVFAVVLAACIRFLAVADSGVHSGLSKLPPNIDHAARNLGRSPLQTMMQVMLPLLQPAVLTSLVLVFVDTVKELSATIILRPIGFNTLATLTYENASRAAVEDGAVAALAIVSVSLIPVLILSRALAADRVA
jgi:iron(III) transport system permease protein